MKKTTCFILILAMIFTMNISIYAVDSQSNTLLSVEEVCGFWQGYYIGSRGDDAVQRDVNLFS